MRLQSNVDLTAIKLEGTGKAQAVGLAGHRRRQGGRRARRHVAGRAELAGAEPVPAARVAAGQPVRVRHRRRSGAGHGSGARRRPRARAAGDRQGAPGRRLHARRSPARSRQPPADRGRDGRGDAPRQLGGRGPHQARAGRRLPAGRPRADVDRAQGRRARGSRAARRARLLPRRARGVVHRGGAPPPARPRASATPTSRRSSNRRAR